MTNVVTILGILVLIIGILGFVGWVDVYQRISGTIDTLNSISSGAQQTAGFFGLFKWVPIIGGGANSISQATAAIANAVGTLAAAITLYLWYNLLLNVALILTGIALIDIGISNKKLKSSVKDTRDYLRQEREKKVK